jgi:hypothetical protein
MTKPTHDEMPAKTFNFAYSKGYSHGIYNQAPASNYNYPPNQKAYRKGYEAGSNYRKKEQMRMLLKGEKHGTR